MTIVQELYFEKDSLQLGRFNSLLMYTCSLFLNESSKLVHTKVLKGPLHSLELFLGSGTTNSLLLVDGNSTLSQQPVFVFSHKPFPIFCYKEEIISVMFIK